MRNVLCVSLLGKFRVRSGDHTFSGFNANKVQDLFCYLLLYRHRPHPREKLATLLWGDTSTAKSRQYLRKALWQLQTALNSRSESVDDGLLLIEPEWVQINPRFDLWLDVALFEQAFATVSGVPGQELDFKQVIALLSAAGLYKGDLLEGCYQEWCLYERERLQHIYLIILDKLMGYCETHREYEAGLARGTLILRYDRARERAHRRMMRLYHIAGHRTAALRQYEQCTAILDQELGVKPSRRTTALYEQIRSDQSYDLPLIATGMTTTFESLPSLLLAVLARLKQRQTVLTDLQRQIEQDIQNVQLVLSDRH